LSDSWVRQRPNSAPWPRSRCETCGMVSGFIPVVHVEYDHWDTGNFSVLSAYVTMVIVLLGGIVGGFSWLVRRLGPQMTRTS
jgi:hypothetical protein